MCIASATSQKLSEEMRKCTVVLGELVCSRHM